MTCMTSACSVEASPSEVDAGADMTLKGKVACSPAGDLRGQTLLIMDQDGALAESVSAQRIRRRDQRDECVRDQGAGQARGLYLVGRVPGLYNGRHFT